MRLALETLVDHRMRSGLVILGVSIAVATAMGMVAILSGLGQKITNDVKGGDTAIFSITRYSHLDEGDNEDRRPRPKLTARDAAEIERIDEMDEVEIRYGHGQERSIEHGDKQARLIFVMGTSMAFQKFQTLDIQSGRFARDWMLENKVNQTSFKATRAKLAEHSIEQVGRASCRERV